jgi:hypothetical protein
MKFGDLGKKLRDLAVTDDGEETKSTPVAPTVAAAKPTSTFDFNSYTGSTPRSGAGTAAAPSPFSVPSTTVLDEAVYQRVLTKTNFDESAVGKVIHKYFDALEDSGMDVNARFKAAIKQAGKLDGVTPQQVLQSFDDLKNALQSEGNKFGQVVDGQTQKEVTSRQQTLQQIADEIAKKNQEIADLQAQHTQLSTELVDAQGRIANAQTQMQLAISRRAQEIDTQKAQFAGLLR